MKKVYFSIVTLFVLNNINAATHLRNNYGAAIEYVKTTPEMARLQPEGYPAIKLGYGAQIELPLMPYLSIRSVGGSYYDISYIFNEIRVHQVNHRDEDPVIVIYPRQGLSGIYSWNIQIAWEKPVSTSNKK